MASAGQIERVKVNFRQNILYIRNSFEKEIPILFVYSKEARRCCNSQSWNQGTTILYHSLPSAARRKERTRIRSIGHACYSLCSL